MLLLLLGLSNENQDVPRTSFCLSYTSSQQVSILPDLIASVWKTDIAAFLSVLRLMLAVIAITSKIIS